MWPEALNASFDFARFAHEHGSTLYFSQFLREGFSSWPLELQNQYPGLADWEGVSKFHNRLRELAEVEETQPVFVASRSTFLMQCGARLLTGPCRNVMITDCTWPAYAKILREQCELSQIQLSVCPVRVQIVNAHCSVEQVVDGAVQMYLKKNCDGLFLPLIDNLGIRLPVEHIVDEIRVRAELRFVVVDGAQALGQVDLNLNSKYYDFFIAGTHKWLCSHHPLGIGFCGHPATTSYIVDSIRRWQASSLLADPVLNFASELSGEPTSQFGETVSVAPLIVANAAISSRRNQSRSVAEKNRQLITQLAGNCGWTVIDTAEEFHSQVLLIEPHESTISASDIQTSLQTSGVAATVYKNRVMRISIPDDLLTNPQLERLQAALSHSVQQPNFSASASICYRQDNPVRPHSGLSI